MSWVIDYDSVGSYKSNLEIVEDVSELKDLIKNYKELEAKGYFDNLVVYEVSKKLSDEEINKLLERKE